MKKPFWEETYKSKEENSIFNFGKPSDEIVLISQMLPIESTVLDIGCGDGRNAIFLAQNGFNVTAFDISESGIEKLEHHAKNLNLQIDSYVQDMNSYKFDRTFDLIITHGSLHLTTRNNSHKIIEDIIQNTNINGYNVHAVFTNTIAPPPDLERNRKINLIFL